MFSAILKILGYGPAPPPGRKPNKFSRMAMNMPTHMDLVHAATRKESSIYLGQPALGPTVPVAADTTPAELTATSSYDATDSLSSASSEEHGPAHHTITPLQPPQPPTNPPRRDSSMISVTAKAGYPLELSYEEFATKRTSHLLEPFSRPTGKWSWLADRPFKEIEILYDQIHIPELSLKKASVAREGAALQESVIYFAQSFIENHQQMPYELAARKRALQDCQDIVPPMIGLYKSAAGFTLNLETPHDCFWIEASPDMPYVLKTACVEAVQRIHLAGALHGSLSLNKVLISPDATVSIYDFSKSRLTFDLPDILSVSETTTQQALDMELAQFKRDLRYNPAYPEPLDFFSELKKEAQILFRKRSNDSPLFVTPGVGYQELVDTIDAFSTRVETMSATPYGVSLKRRHPDPEDMAPPAKRKTPPPVDRFARFPGFRDDSEDDDTSTAVDSPAGSVAGGLEFIASLDCVPSGSPLPTPAPLPEHDGASLPSPPSPPYQFFNAIAGPSRLTTEILDQLDIPRVVVTAPEGTVTPLPEVEELQFPSLKAFLKMRKRAREEAGEEAWSTDSSDEDSSASGASAPVASTSQEPSQPAAKRRRIDKASSSNV